MPEMTRRIAGRMGDPIKRSTPTPTKTHAGGNKIVVEGDVGARDEIWAVERPDHDLTIPRCISHLHPVSR